MFCETCTKRETCKKLCEKVNQYLKSNGIYNADYIRPEISSSKRRHERKMGLSLSKYREIPFSSLKNYSKDGEIVDNFNGFDTI